MLKDELSLEALSLDPQLKQNIRDMPFLGCLTELQQHVLDKILKEEHEVLHFIGTNDYTPWNPETSEDTLLGNEHLLERVTFKGWELNLKIRAEIGIHLRNRCSPCELSDMQT